LKILKEGPKYVPNLKVANVNDTRNTSCTICSLVFGNRHKYTHHMLTHKKLGYTAIRGRSKINPDITPDVDDSNFFANRVIVLSLVVLVIEICMILSCSHRWINLTNECQQVFFKDVRHLQ
jgi:hypothetical protein